MKHNREAWNQEVQKENIGTKPVNSTVIEDARKGKINLLMYKRVITQTMSLRESNHFRFSHLALVLLITVLASGCSRGADKNPEDTFSIRSASGVDLITINDIQEYHWPTHTLTLAPDVLERLQKQLAGELVSGYLFDVLANGEVVYQGTMTIGVSSFSFSSVVIARGHQLRKYNQIRIELGYPSQDYFKGTDPRNNHDLLESLREANIIIGDDI